MINLRRGAALRVALVILASGLAVALPLSIASASADQANKPVSLASLLAEMVDRDALARLPAPAYTCRQFSSYDRASRSPDQDWFANGDANQYLRTEQHDGRQEWVMMDAAGPGAVVRIWSANPPADGTLRVYLDGAGGPVIAAPMADVLGGRWRVSAPLAAVRSRGWNLYLPIPYAGHCKITCDKPGFYYQINYRTYEAGTPVESFREAALTEAAGAIARVRETLLHPPAPGGESKALLDETVPPGGQKSVDVPSGPRAIRSLNLHLGAEDLAVALRSAILRIEFDGREAVWCPIGDFFGTGIGLNVSSDWWRSAAAERLWSEGAEEGTLTCRWVMPFRESCRISILNLSDQPVRAQLAAAVGPWQWDDRSMHFHAVWRQENPIHTQPRQDWNYVEVRGAGVFVGDTLAVTNPVKTWWGEGDEKIYVDGETFPSHFGTGTEDYYGYAWGSPEPFEGPFHAQPRCDGPDNYGHTTVSRVRILDAIPFRESFRFDMEVWHWKECDVGYAATSYLYARPGATHNRAPQPEEAARGPIDPAPLPPPFRVEGAIEAESLKILARSPDVSADSQGGFGQIWSGEQQLFVQARRVGDFIELEIPVADGGQHRLAVHATRSWDYGIVRFHVDGRRAGEDQDLFNSKARDVVATGPIDLGVVMPEGGRIVLRIEVVGSNRRADKPGTYFGIDCVVLTRL